LIIIAKILKYRGWGPDRYDRGGTDNHNIDDDVSYRTKLKELAGTRSKGEEIQTTKINNINR